MAESIVEFKPVRGVFLYEGFRHSLDLSYDFQNNESDLNKNSSHAYRERYNASLQVALFDPRIFDAILQGSLALNQSQNKNDSSSSDSSNRSLQYNFSGSGLNRSRIPFTLLNYRSTNTVLNNFSPPTTSDDSGSQFEISFLNSQLQSKFRFIRSNTETTVAGATSSTLMNTYSYSAEHKYGGFSDTTLNAFFSDQTGSSTSSAKLTATANSLTLTNSLNLGVRHKYSLLSTFLLSNTTTDNRPSRFITFSETFSTNLGRALFLNATYFVTNSRQNGYNELVVENTLNHGDVKISHSLFDSLYTELSGSLDFNDSNEGYENRSSVRGSTTYTKSLSSANQLSLGLSKQYNVTDRQVSSGTTTINAEPHTKIHQGDVIELALADGTLRNVGAVMSRNPLFTYIEGVDYTVNYPLGRITILSGVGVRIDMDGNGTDLFISFTVYRDPQLKYASESLSLTSQLSLLNKQITLGSAWSKTRQKLIGGPADNSLQDASSLMLYANGNYDNFNCRFSYLNAETGGLTFQTFEGNGSASMQTSRSVLALAASDSYTLYDATSTSVAYRENSASVSLSYTRNMVKNSQFTLTGTLSDFRSELTPASDSLSLRANYRISFDAMTISLYAQTNLIFSTYGTTRSDSFHAGLTRYF